MKPRSFGGGGGWPGRAPTYSRDRRRPRPAQAHVAPVALQALRRQDPVGDEILLAHRRRQVRAFDPRLRRARGVGGVHVVAVGLLDDFAEQALGPRAAPPRGGGGFVVSVRRRRRLLRLGLLRRAPFLAARLALDALDAQQDAREGVEGVRVGGGFPVLVLALGLADQRGEDEGAEHVARGRGDVARAFAVSGRVRGAGADGLGEESGFLDPGLRTFAAPGVAAQAGGGEGRGAGVGEGALHSVEDFGLRDAFGEEGVDAVAEFFGEAVDVVGAPGLGRGVGGGEVGHGGGPVRDAFPPIEA